MNTWEQDHEIHVHVKWECPECKAPPNKHGNGGSDKCGMDRRGYEVTIAKASSASVTRTRKTMASRKTSLAFMLAATTADGAGRFPPLPKKLKPFEKKALDAGWTPPKGWIGS